MNVIRTYVRNLYRYHRQKIYEIIMHHYSDWERPSEPDIVRDELMELLGDAQFVAPVMELTDYHSRFNAKTFLYAWVYLAYNKTYCDSIGHNYNI